MSGAQRPFVCIEEICLKGFGENDRSSHVFSIMDNTWHEVDAHQLHVNSLPLISLSSSTFSLKFLRETFVIEAHLSAIKELKYFSPRKKGIFSFPVLACFQFQFHSLNSAHILRIV